MSDFFFSITNERIIFAYLLRECQTGRHLALVSDVQTSSQIFSTLDVQGSSVISTAQNIE